MRGNLHHLLNCDTHKQSRDRRALMRGEACKKFLTSEPKDGYINSPEGRERGGRGAGGGQQKSH